MATRVRPDRQFCSSLFFWTLLLVKRFDTHRSLNSAGFTFVPYTTPWNYKEWVGKVLSIEHSVEFIFNPENVVLAVADEKNGNCMLQQRQSVYGFACRGERASCSLTILPFILSALWSVQGGSSRLRTGLGFFRFGKFPWLVGRFCSYLPPKQDGGTS